MRTDATALGTGVEVPLDDHALAARLATLAGDALVAERTLCAGLDERVVRDRGDAVAQAVLAAALARLAPADAVLSEEAKDDPARLTARRVWIIDPLDGTREYAEGRDDFAVHVALWADGDLRAGAVALPARGVVRSTAVEAPAVRTHDGPLRMAASRSRAPQLVEDVRRLTDGVLVPMGSAGVKTMAVVDGTVDAYLHAGGQYEWDSAAPVAVARAHGLHASRVDGSPLHYNCADPWLPDLLVCRPELADDLLDTIAECLPPTDRTENP